ncbi:hypothetical protein [Saccharicrinis sp. 156]|uniref:hypothetical protein n=1 Tax=Saccharicrinis sp. 156 TaxID=3417574 RepID=UPI003D340D29
MSLEQEIKKDFEEQMAFLKKQKMSTRIRFHHKRAGVIGSLLFLADVAEKNEKLALYESLIKHAKFARNAMEEQFKASWLHNMRDVTKMQSAFLCDISLGYNAAREQYSNLRINLPEKLSTGNVCSTKPAVKAAINKLIAKLVGED